MRKLLLLPVALMLAVAPVFGVTNDKIGTPVDPQLPGVDPTPGNLVFDWVYNTGGAEDFVPDTGGSSDGWGEWFITTVLNDTGQDLLLTELGFPCSGPPTGPYGWIVWLDMGGIMPPAGDASTADYFGEFTPNDPDPATFPPTVYTYIDVTAENIVVPAGTYFCFGYDNTGTGGQTLYNGVETWAWYTGVWDPDSGWGRTAILQVKADFLGATPIEEVSWAGIKALY